MGVAGLVSPHHCTARALVRAGLYRLVTQEVKLGLCSTKSGEQSRMQALVGVRDNLFTFTDVRSILTSRTHTHPLECQFYTLAPPNLG